MEIREEKIKNLKIIEYIKFPTKITKVIEERGLKWFRYLKRMRSNIILKLILEWIADSRRIMRKHRDQ